MLLDGTCLFLIVEAPTSHIVFRQELTRHRGAKCCTYSHTAQPHSLRLSSLTDRRFLRQQSAKPSEPHTDKSMCKCVHVRMHTHTHRYFICVSHRNCPDFSPWRAWAVQLLTHSSPQDEGGRPEGTSALDLVPGSTSH